MTTLRERTQRLLEEVAFRLWVGTGIALGAALAARYLLQALRSRDDAP